MKDITEHNLEQTFENKREKDKKDLKKEYCTLKETYSLPDYDLLNQDFEIENIDADENILREILREIHDHIEFYSRLLEGLIQPDSKLCDMKEAGSLGEKDQFIITELYRKCMLINRNLLLANLDYSNELAAKEISETHKDWQNIKKDLKIILSKMRDTWKQESEKETQKKEKHEKHGGYYG